MIAASSRHYDLIVIGSGAGAMAAAIRAHDLGRSALLVERRMAGGTCVNVGCIPSKSLLVASERHPGSLGHAVQAKDALIDRLRRSKYLDLLADHGIELSTARAELLGPHTVAVDGEPFSAEGIIIASGARPARPPIEGLDEAGYLTSTTAMELSEPPARIAVIGANAVGLELGQMLGNFGSHVTFVSRRAIAPRSEPEVSQVIGQVLLEQGHELLEDAWTESAAVEGDEKVVRGRVGADKPFEIRANEILIAVGRSPNTQDLGLQRVRIQTDARGRIVVDERQRTSVPSIYAVGDVTTQPQHVYVAAAGGTAAAENALAGGDERLDFSALPRVVFTKPQVAAAGLTEAQAREAGFDVETAALALDAVPRALVNGDTRGLVKLIAEAGTRRLIGASVVAEGAAEVIQSAVLAIDRGLTAAELAASWAPYLTMAEGLRLAAQTFERDVAKLSCCAA